jgi:exosortase H (IPTLxxWG-CTERM-specific)
MMRPERFLILFAICLLGLFGLLLAPFARPGVLAFSHGLVSAAGLLIHLCGGHAMVEGTVLRSSPNGFAIEMKDGCNGANVLILLWSAVIAFPATMFYKVKGVLWGALTIQSVNLLRFISLFYLGQYSLSLFAFAHEYLWESLIMLDGLLFFGWWVHLVFQSFPRPNANR